MNPMARRALRRIEEAYDDGDVDEQDLRDAWDEVGEYEYDEGDYDDRWF